MSLQQINILLADDDTDDCFFFKEALSELTIPANLTTVHDGENLMKLLKDKENELPDVLYLDINMPRKNGFECLAEVKFDVRLKQLPIIILTTSFEQEVVNLLYRNGAQYFIRKPSEFSQFKKIIQQSVELMSKGNISQPVKENFVLTVNNISDI